MNNKNILILLTSSYPLENGETFVENEIKFLEAYFDKIIIFCSAKNNKVLDRFIPKNAEIIYFNSNTVNSLEKLFSLKYIFTSYFWSEFFFVKNKIGIKSIFNISKTLLIELLKAKKLASFIKNKTSKLDTNDNLFFYAYWLNYFAIALIFLKKKNIKGAFFSRAHGWDLYNERSECNYLPLRNFIYKNMDAIFPISINGAKYINLNYTKSKTQIGATIFTSKLGTNFHGHNTENMRKDHFTIVSCSMIYPNKQVDLIAKSLTNLNCNQTIEWVHFGSFIPNFSEEHYKELLNIIENNKNIRLTIRLMGLVNNNDIMKYYLNSHIDAFINLSLSEGIPVSIMEAMSFGIPIIATAVGGTPEIVKNGFNGFLLSENPTVEEVDNTIRMFCNLSDQDKCKMRQNSFNTWNTEYNAEINYKEFAEKIFTI